MTDRGGWLVQTDAGPHEKFETWAAAVLAAHHLAEGCSRRGEMFDMVCEVRGRASSVLDGRRRRESGAEVPPPAPNGRDHLDWYVGKLNLCHFLDQLDHEGDPQRRAALRTVLIEEEDKLGRRDDYLIWMAERKDELKRRILRQSEIVNRSWANEAAADRARTLFYNMIDTHNLMEYRWLSLNCS
jgi:hypothetical protein